MPLLSSAMSLFRWLACFAIVQDFVTVANGFNPAVPLSKRHACTNSRTSFHPLFTAAEGGLQDQQQHHVSSVYDAKTAQSLQKYKAEHKRSIEDPEGFWAEKAVQYLDWEKPFDSVLHGSLEQGDVSWFGGGKLNMAYNAIDRHVYEGKADQVAIIWEGDEPDDIRKITYGELLAKVSRIANALSASGVRKGDVVTIYMPMIPELAMTMLACSRLGAVHSVVFAGFSAEALAQRIVGKRNLSVSFSIASCAIHMFVVILESAKHLLSWLCCSSFIKQFLSFSEKYPSCVEQNLGNGRHWRSWKQANSSKIHC